MILFWEAYWIKHNHELTLLECTTPWHGPWEIKIKYNTYWCYDELYSALSTTHVISFSFELRGGRLVRMTERSKFNFTQYHGVVLVLKCIIVRGNHQIYSNLFSWETGYFHSVLYFYVTKFLPSMDCTVLLKASLSHDRFKTQDESK